MPKKEEGKKRNVAIELWRVLIAISIVGFHIGWIIARTCDGSNGYWMETSNWFFGSSEVLLIFTLTAGYFMVAHHKKLVNKIEYKERSAASRAWEYTWSRVKSLLPVLIIGYILGVVICTKFYYPNYGIQEVCTMIVNSVWEFLGFHAAGLRSTGGEFFNLNGPLWFISAIIIVGYFLYWGLCKNEDFVSGILAPFGFIFLSGWWCYTGTRAAQTGWSTLGTQLASTNGMGGSATDATATIGFNNGLIFVLIGMLGGIILYYLVNKAKEHNFSEGGRFLLTVINIICSALLLWYVIYQPTYFNLERWTVALLCIVVVGLSLINKDYLSLLLNNKYTNKLFAFLGSISLYIYMLHYPIAIMMIRLLGTNTEATTYSFWLIFIPTILITIALSIFTKFIMESTILKKAKN
jgi:peptidoglycan/LPS O-acetylase OafA/YrhL